MTGRVKALPSASPLPGEEEAGVGDSDGGLHELMHRARALAPLLAAAAPEIESKRELTPDVLKALHPAGLFRMLLPRSLGGHEVPAPVYLEVLEELAKADASTAWCIGQTSVCSTMAASLKHEVASEIFGKDSRAVLAWGPLGRSSKAIRTKEGFRVSGTWHYASGSRHATWLGGHCHVFDENAAQAMDAEGKPLEITAIFPRERASFTDDWHVMGLKGTGSNSYAVTDLLVPGEFCVTSFGRNPAERWEHGPLYRFTVFQLFGASFAAVALGIARAALDAFVELAKGKTPTGKQTVLRDNAVVQSQIGVAESGLCAARVFLSHAMRQMWQGAQQGDITTEQRVALRMASAHASQQARAVVDMAHYAAGGTAIFENNAFERRFRDMHAVSQQAQAHFSMFEVLGQYFLGQPIHPRYI
jgi:alkylation response protein AidB-like acyl-CoA dehydrogenase